MPTPFGSAQLNLKLYELRREPTLREARAWFLHGFNPETLAELVSVAGGEHNARFRMVLGYWDMAASLVTTGAIERHAFLAAHGEVIATFAKIFPFLPELRAAAEEPAFCEHLEQVLTADPATVDAMRRRREKIIAAAHRNTPAPVSNPS